MQRGVVVLGGPAGAGARHGIQHDGIRFATGLAEYAVARIPPRARIDAALDLVRGTPVDSADFEEFLRRTPRHGDHG